MLDALKREVWKQNLRLRDLDLVLFTWGNVSAIERESGLTQAFSIARPRAVTLTSTLPSKSKIAIDEFLTECLPATVSSTFTLYSPTGVHSVSSGAPASLTSRPNDRLTGASAGTG